jgi:GNAT superfamily N-acetyltransferase
MRPADIPTAIALTDIEDWGCTPGIFRRLMHLDPRGCLKAVLDGEMIGLTTATSYGDAGWIGNVIVHTRHRGKGIGVQLVESAIGYLEGTGAETVRLNSYIHVTSLYGALGFKGEYENVRYNGVIKPGGGPAPQSSSHFGDVVSFDERYFGCSRKRLLWRLRREFPRTFISAGDGDVKGYIVGQVEEGSCEVAPWVVDHRRKECARELWRALAEIVGETRVAFTAPLPCEQASSIARWAGLKRGFRTLRMCRGRRGHGGRPAGTIALGGLEKG